MGHNTLHDCMDYSEWLHQGATVEEVVAAGMGSSSPSSTDMLTCSRPLIERRLRPPQDQNLKCPRCDSTHTKFCYYNNYSLSQPRYFCKTCRRYWTKGGTLRNIPVGGGCRKNKKSSSKKSNDQNPNSATQISPIGSSSSHNLTDLHLSFPEVQIPHIANMIGPQMGLGNTHFLETKYNAMLEGDNPRPTHDFLDSKYENWVSANTANMGGINIGDGVIMGGGGSNFNGFGSSFGGLVSNNINDHNFVDHRFMLPYDHSANEDQSHVMDVKPNTKLLSLEWQDQGCSDPAYLNNLSLWNSAAMMGGYNPSTTNPLV